MKQLTISSSSFKNNGPIPKKHTGFDIDISPSFHIEGLCQETVSIAIIMDDLDIPIISAYNHWTIWNIPKAEDIPENISYGQVVSELSGAKQGVGYGKNRYRGPKQPPFIKKAHRYCFTVYALDCFLDIKTSSHKSNLLHAMKGHILQCGSITGWYKPER